MTWNPNPIGSLPQSQALAKAGYVPSEYGGSSRHHVSHKNKVTGLSTVGSRQAPQVSREQQIMISQQKQQQTTTQSNLNPLAWTDPLGLGRLQEAEKERILWEIQVTRYNVNIENYNRYFEQEKSQGDILTYPSESGVSYVTINPFTQKEIEKRYNELEGQKFVVEEYKKSVSTVEESRANSILGLWEGTHPVAKEWQKETSKLPSWQELKEESHRGYIQTPKSREYSIDLGPVVNLIGRKINEIDISYKMTTKEGLLVEKPIIKGPDIVRYAQLPGKTAEEYMQGEYEGIKSSPMKAAITGGLFFFGTGVLGAGTKFVKGTGVLAKITAATGITGKALKPAVIITGVGLTTLYGTSVVERVKNPEFLPGKSSAYKLGWISSTEIQPAIIGGYAGAEFWPRAESWWRLRGTKVISKESLIEPQVLAGKENYPQFKVGTTPTGARMEFYQGEYSLPRARGELPTWEEHYWISGYEGGKAYPEMLNPSGMWHTTISQYPDISRVMSPEQLAAQGIKGSELPGLFGGPSVSPAFLRVGNRYSLYNVNTQIGIDWGEPTANWINIPKGIETTPRGVKGLSQGYEFLLNTADKEKAYVTLGFYPKMEEQAILPPGAVFEKVTTKPIESFWLQGYKIGIQESTVIGGNKIRIPEGINPQSILTGSASSYLINVPSYSAINPYSSAFLYASSGISGKYSYKSTPSYSYTSPYSYTSYAPSTPSYPKYTSYSPSVPSVPSYKYYSYPPSSIIKPLPATILPTLPPQFFDLGSKVSSQLRKQPFKYQPSFTASVLGIKSKRQPKTLTGLEFRPIVIGRRKR